LIDFEELLPNIESAIKGCSFLCVDGEFTGLNDGTDILPYETPSDYYDKLRKGALDYLFVQFGLSAFTYNCKTKKYYTFSIVLYFSNNFERFHVRIAQSTTTPTSEGFIFSAYFMVSGILLMV
jgi:hypothetical protein